jgi:hypothetical protein
MRERTTSLPSDPSRFLDSSNRRNNDETRGTETLAEGVGRYIEFREQVRVQSNSGLAGFDWGP